MKITQVTKTVSSKQWNEFTPIHQLANNLIATAGALMELPAHVRGKIQMSIQIGTEVDGSTRKRTATKPQRSPAVTTVGAKRRNEFHS
jgi:hypothetical protein